MTTMIGPDSAKLTAAQKVAEKHGAKRVERILMHLYDTYRLDPSDIEHAAESDRHHGFDATEAAIGLGFRGADISLAAGAVKLWPDPAAAKMSFEQARLVAEATPPPEAPVVLQEAPPSPTGSPDLIPGPESVASAPAAAPVPSAAEISGEDAAALTAYGFPAEELAEAQRAYRKYPKGLAAISPFAAGKVPVEILYHSASAAETYPVESVERILTRLVPEFKLDGQDVFQAVAADKLHGFEATKLAVSLGWRRGDIPHAASAALLWPNMAMARDGLRRLRKLFDKLKIDVMEGDIRHCANTMRQLNEDLLERALRDRHPKNEREPWIQGVSIQIVAWAYKLSAPHTGPAIDEGRKQNTRRDRIGHFVLSFLGRKFGRPVQMPPWLGGGRD